MSPDADQSTIEKRLESLRQDYQSVEGKFFNHFFCPILFKDEPAELCMGHIINRQIADSSRRCVVQRKDVDSFFGKTFECDFVTLAQASTKNVHDVVFDPKLNKKLKPKIFAGDEQCDYHAARGHQAADQTGVVLEHKDGKLWDIVLHKAPDEVVQPGKKWSVVVDHDCRVQAVASLIKAAHLTLFDMLGYRYALSAGGFEVGYNILGGFYREFCDKSTAEAKRAAADYFKKYIHMVRPVASWTGAPPLGTIEDRRLSVCFGTSKRAFAYIVSVKVGAQIHGVLMPAYDNAESAVTYLDFLSNDKDILNANTCIFDPKENCWHGTDIPVEIHWTKKGVDFDPYDPEDLDGQ
jgi:hypothetical protein